MYNFATSGVAHHTHQAVVESKPAESKSKGSGGGGTFLIILLLIIVVGVAFYFYRRSDNKQ